MGLGIALDPVHTTKAFLPFTEKVTLFLRTGHPVFPHMEGVLLLGPLDLAEIRG